MADTGLDAYRKANAIDPSDVTRPAPATNVFRASLVLRLKHYLAQPYNITRSKHCTRVGILDTILGSALSDCILTCALKRLIRLRHRQSSSHHAESSHQSYTTTLISQQQQQLPRPHQSPNQHLPTLLERQLTHHGQQKHRPRNRLHGPPLLRSQMGQATEGRLHRRQRRLPRVGSRLAQNARQRGRRRRRNGQHNPPPVQTPLHHRRPAIPSPG